MMKAQKIKKVVIAAAGLGTRFLPITKTIPKEMLPVVDKPCIQYIVEEAIQSGIKEIIIVTGKNKRAMEDYFDSSFELYYNLRKNKKFKELRELEQLEKMAKFFYVRQLHPRGDGHAILCAKEIVDDEPFAVLFGDDFFDSKVPALKQLINEYEHYNAPVVALQKVPKEETNKYGIIAGKKISERTFEINHFVEKPKVEEAPSDMAIVGKYIVTPELMRTLATIKTAKKTELKLINAMYEYVKNKPIYGIDIEGERFDTGDKLGYLKAVVHFALKDEKLKDGFAKFLKSL